MSRNSVLEKLIPLGTIQRNKQQKKEIEKMNLEGITAIQQIQNVNLDPEVYQLKENEERSALEVSEKKKLEPIIKMLIGWINNELSDKRVIIKDLQEDMYDGQIFQLLIEKLSNSKLSTESKPNLGEASRKHNLKTVIEFINLAMNIHPMMSKWKIESIYEKDLISIIHLLVAIVRYYNVPLNLPEDLTVKVIIIQKKKKLEKITMIEKITGSSSVESKKKDRDAFDALFDHAPEKLDLVKNSLLTFLRKHLSKINISIDSLDDQLDNGIHLIMLMGILEGYYIPEFAYYATADTSEKKLENCRFLFELIDDAGLQKPNCLPEDIANKDLKSILRILYILFSNYKDRD